MLKEFPWLYPATEVLTGRDLDVRGALARGEYEQAAILIVELARRAVCGEQTVNLTKLADWTSALPDAIRQQPAILFADAWLTINTSDLIASLVKMKSLLCRLDSDHSSMPQENIRAWVMNVSLAQGVILDSLGHQEQAHVAIARALSLLPKQTESAPLMLPFSLPPEEVERLQQLDPCGLNEFLLTAINSHEWTNDHLGLAHICHNVGVTYLECGEPVQARQWLEHALELKKAMPGRLPVTFTMVNLAECYRQLGQLQKARLAGEESLQASREMSAPFLEAYCLLALGAILRDQREMDRAIVILQQAITLMDGIGNRLGISQVHLELAILYRLSGQAAQSAEYARRARSVFTRSHRGYELAQLQMDIARLLLGTGNLSSLQQPGRACKRSEILTGWYQALSFLNAGQHQEALHLAGKTLEQAGDWRHLHLLAQEIPPTLSLFDLVFSEVVCPSGLTGILNYAVPKDMQLLTSHIPQAAQLALQCGNVPRTVTVMIQLLGGLRVLHEGMEIDIGEVRSQKALQILRVLALWKGRLTSREQIIEAVWEDQNGEGAHQSFDVALSTMRKFLAKEGLGSIIIRRGKSYQLDPSASVATDVELFIRHCEQGYQWWQYGRASEAAREWEAALALYQGDLLNDEPYADWVLSDRERLCEMYLDLLTRLGEMAVSDQRYDRAVDLANQVLARDPLRETAYRLLMLAHSRQGNRAVAMRDYQRCVNVLRKELDVEPMQETIRLAECILGGAQT